MNLYTKFYIFLKQLRKSIILSYFFLQFCMVSVSNLDPQNVPIIKSYSSLSFSFSLPFCLTLFFPRHFFPNIFFSFFLYYFHLAIYRVVCCVHVISCLLRSRKRIVKSFSTSFRGSLVLVKKQGAGSETNGSGSYLK